MRLLHVIPQIDGGGPARSLVVFVRETQAAGLAIEHRILALSRQANAPMIALLARLGAMPVLAPNPATAAALVAAADVVLVHFWTSPAMAAFFAAPLPTCRLFFWSKVDGRHLPQLLLPEHGAFADAIVPSGPLNPNLGTDCIPGFGDFARLDPPGNWAARNTVAFVGTLNRAKLHSDFFALSDRVPAPGWKFPLVGGPLDAWFAAHHAESRDPDRYEIPGFLENVSPVYARAAVLGYPLSPDTYATCDKVLQEAMWAGVPPVVIAGRGPAPFVTDGETGRVAAADADYPALVAALVDSPGERRRLGEAASADARRMFDPAANARRLLEKLNALMLRPKRNREPLFGSPPQPVAQGHAAAYRLASGFGAAGVPLRRALGDPSPAAIAEAVRALAALPPIAISAEGGVFHFRKHHSEDFALRLWAAILLTVAGDGERAAGEFEAARALGAPEAVLAYETAAMALRESTGTIADGKG